MFTVEQLCVSYKNVTALRNATFHASEGTITGLIGADGTGKSSLLNAIAGVIDFHGTVTLDDMIYKTAAQAIPLKRHMALMPQGLGLFLYKSLTIEEHLSFFEGVRKIAMSDEYIAYKKRLLDMSGLGRFMKRRAGDLSGGMMQKLALICTMLHRPRLLLLDEPTTGVDPVSRFELWEIVRRIVDENKLICLVSTAYMAEAEKFDTLLLFDDASIIEQGSFIDLTQKIAPYCFEPMADDKSVPHERLSINGFTYSMTPIENRANKVPDLESIFFVRELRRSGAIASVSLEAHARGESQTVIEAKNITKRFGSFVANEHVNLCLRSGEIVGLLGANGAGKTTFLKMLLGLLAIDEGELLLFGRTITQQDDRIALKREIGYVSQRFAMYKKLTVYENLLYFGNMRSIDEVELRESIALFGDILGLSPYFSAFPSEIPMGINQRLSLAAAILHRPKLLVLDEPTSGVDVVARAVFWGILRELRDKWGISVLITTHYMSEAEFCDRVVVLKDGKKIVDDSLAAIHRTYPNAANFEEIFLELFRCA